MITPEQRAEILRLYYAEHWKVGTIASALGVHHDTVRSALGLSSRRLCRQVRPSMLDPFVPFIEETLKQYPRICATRVYEMIRERGYLGKSPAQVRRLVRRIRPRRPAEAYLMLQVFPAEQGQVDWGSFGKILVDKTERNLSCFVMVLSFSRALHVYFSLDQTLESFLRGHVEAFEYFGGVPRVLLYDNLKSAVLERCGEAIRFHPRLLELAGHYHFAPRPCAPARGNEKGRVERAIRYLRTSFFSGRTYRDIEDLKGQFEKWRREVAHRRKVPGGSGLVEAALEQERPSLLPLPANRFETDLVKTVSSGKTPYVRFDSNQYSIPYKLVRKPLTLVADEKEVRLFDGQELVARHARSFEKGKVVEDPAHIEALVEAKRNAQSGKRRDVLITLVPQLQDFFNVLAVRGEAMGYHTHRLLGLLDRYGVEELRHAVAVAVGRQAYAAGSVAHVLEQRRRALGLTPPVPVTLPDDPRIKGLCITPHNLEDYDELGRNDDERNR